ncbi:MAG: flagellar hook-basal body protein [Synergistaceae bacterium]|nr:flagellar hook-basal body protein [Synergistaceae bacterium]
MHRGLYAAASAMLVQETNLDVVTNNLANVDTAGFRRRVSANAEFSALMNRIEKISEDGETKITTYPPFTMNWRGKQIIGGMALANVYSQSFMDTQPGIIKTTDNPLDVAINGPGFFAVQDEAGNTYYTRQGNFLVGADGNIVTLDGMTLQSDGGPIGVEEGTSVEILNNGQVLVDGELVGEIALFTFENPTYLQQVGRNCLIANEDSGEPVPVDDVRLVPGTLESSNVSVVEEMVRMIEAHRAYEGASKALMTHDESTGRLIASFGRQ